MVPTAFVIVWLPVRAVFYSEPVVVWKTKVGVAGESLTGIPSAKVQVTVVSPFEDTPVPVTPRRLQSMLSAAVRAVPVNVRVVSSPLSVMEVTVGDVLVIASN